MMKKFLISNFQFPIKSIVLVFTLYIVHFTFFPSPVYAQQATLGLSPVNGTFNRSCTFSLDINLATGGGDTDGTDAILIYDPSRFSATSITNGTIYSEYPGNNIDDTNGKITISGLASVASPFNGSGKLATINFIVKDNAATGATQINFDFDPANKAKTTDSNVVQRGTVVDTLNSVTNGSYTVGSNSCASGSNGSAGNGAPKGGTATPSASLQPGGTNPLSCPVTGQAGTRRIPTCNNQWGYDQCSVAASDDKGRPTSYHCTYSGNSTCTMDVTCQLPPGANESLTYTVAIIGSVMVTLGVLGLAFL